MTGIGLKSLWVKWGVFHNIDLVFANKGVFSIICFLYNMGPNNKYGLHLGSKMVSGGRYVGQF
jgi:hypothetical protein